MKDVPQVAPYRICKHISTLNAASSSPLIHPHTLYIALQGADLPFPFVLITRYYKLPAVALNRILSKQAVKIKMAQFRNWRADSISGVAASGAGRWRSKSHTPRLTRCGSRWSLVTESGSGKVRLT